MSKVILDCLGFTELHSKISTGNSHHYINQSDAKLKKIAPWSCAFSCALALVGSKIFSFLLVGCWYNFGFSSTTFNRKALKITSERSLTLMDVDCWLQKKYFGNMKGTLTRVIEARIRHSVCWKKKKLVSFQQGQWVVHHASDLNEESSNMLNVILL